MFCVVNLFAAALLGSNTIFPLGPVSLCLIFVYRESLHH
jgi:hypothetical protein